MSEKLNTVSGQIVLEELNLPLPNLLVEIFTIDNFNVIPPITETTTREEIRLASGLSGPEGSFSIGFEDIELPDVFTDDIVPNPNLNNRKWYNLFLVVKSGNHILHKTDTRERAGRREVFQITVSKEAFSEAGLNLPEESNEGKTLKEALKESLQKEKDLQEDIRELLQGELDHERSREAQKDEQFLKPLLNTLTRLPDSIRNSRYNFVNKGDSVAETTRQNISRKISYVFNRESLNKGPKSDGWIALNDEQQQALFKNDFKEEDGSYLLPEEISRQVFENILRNKAVGEANTTELLHKHPLHKYCTPISAQQKNCMTALGLELPGAHENDPAKGNDATASTEDGPFEANKDLQQYIDTQMQYAAAPEEPVRFGVGARATLAEIEEKVRALSLRPSPADMPAYFDFHSIQIAFEHVWQEAIDEGVLDLAGNVYDEIVNLGGTPPPPQDNKVSFAAVKREVRTVARTAVIKKQDITIPKKVSEEFPSAANAWGRLTFQGRKMLEDHADKIQTYEKQMLLPFNNKYTLEQAIKKLRAKGNDMIRKATPATASSSSAPTRSKPGYEWVNGRWVRIKRGTVSNRQPQDVDELVNELEAQLKEKNYSFTTYAANEKERSVNFGILVTYRQKWEPVSYQAGELVKTIPLAPKETRKYSKKVTVKRKRIEKEIENSLKVLKTDSSETGRAESEIMDKALQKNSFQQNSSASGSYTIGAATANNTTSTNFTGDASRESRNLKKSFRENVFKAAQEYKNERKLEIVTEESFDSEYNESGEISNPNDELPVTYLFYELQRRYKVTERIHRLRPVIFVAQEMPKPEDIDEDWILTHDWIIRRILLDDSFLPALNYLSNITADEFVLIEMEKDIEEQRQLVRDVRISFDTIKKETETRYRVLQKMIDEQAGVIQDKDWYDGVPIISSIGNTAENVISSVGNFLFGGGGDDDKEAARLRAEAARDAYDKAAQQQRELMTRLSGETDKLQSLSDKYNQKLSDKIQKDIQIARLKVHIKQNILHYMHSIWSHEHPDQRFFRLHNVEVPTLEGNLKLKIYPESENGRVQPGYNPGKRRFRFSVNPDISREFTTLEQVADLDDLLGFKGNYMIFGLKSNNVLTDFMMAPYIDQELGLKDPDEFGNWTLDEFAQYVCCLKKELPEDEFTPLIPELTEAYKKLLTDPLRQGEEIVVPTGSLFIEALPGTHSILEDFKLVHRAIDVKKVQAEVREMELENIRLAARLQAGQLDDPDVEKKIIVEGNGNGVKVES